MLLSRFILLRSPQIRWPSPLRHLHTCHILRNGAEFKRKPCYITTPIFYPNAKPHIGHLYTLVLGDVFARYQRLVEPDREVKLLVGTDEHGLKIQQAARAQGQEEGEFVDALSEVFKNLSARANISYTTFARTTQDRHRKTVEHVWRSLEEKGFIYKGEYEGWYSITDECFYTATQIEPTPDGEAYISKETGSKVEWTKEHNYMFRLSAFREALAQHYTPLSKDARTHVVPSQYNSVVLQMLGASSPSPAENAEQLADISISRPRSRLSWGIPVPTDPEHTVYVWFDALLIYLSGVGYPWSNSATSHSHVAAAEKNAGWPADLQIIGKDILRFHAIYLPAILFALSGPSYSTLASSPALVSNATPGLPSRLLTHAHWTVSAAKMSKSVGNVVDPLAAMEEWGVDIVRWYFARVGGRFRDDVDWSFEQLEKHSRELQSLLGNYLLRVASPRIVKAAEKGRLELASTSSTSDVAVGAYAFQHTLNADLSREAAALARKVQDNMERLEVAEAVEAVVDVLKLANKTITDIAPWSKTCPLSVVYETRQVALLTLRVAGICLRPFVPETSANLMSALGRDMESGSGDGWQSVLLLEDEGELRKEIERTWKVDGVRLF